MTSPVSAKRDVLQALRQLPDDADWRDIVRASSPELPNARDFAIRAVTELPDDASWEEIRDLLLYYGRAGEGLEDVHAGREKSHEEFARELGIELES